ncbi:MAG: hypothetical protein ABSD29_25795 [Verrucomicrobiota bacterium]
MKAKAMPSDDGLGLEEEQSFLPVCREAQQPHPKQSVGGAEFGFARLPFEQGELMSKRQIFKPEPGTGFEAGEQGAEKRQNDIEHDEAKFGRRGRKTNAFKGLRGVRYPQRTALGQYGR